jgi:putative transposase
MSRISRVVVPGLPHHVTQRGNGKQDTFACQQDRMVYLSLLRDEARRREVRIWAWCLMSNHVHFLMVPSSEDALARTLGRTHAEYAQYWNARRQVCGHVWQARFFSCVVEPGAAWVVARYVETNPVRAGMVQAAQDWRWSSAAAHATGRDGFALLELSQWGNEYDCARWRDVLRTSVEDEAWRRRLEEATIRGRPLGTESFVQSLEVRLDRSLRPKPPGRPAKARDETETRAERMALEIGV